ncbi:MAG: CHASE domain-containing protein, partial [Gallionella sp.]|nr:CHASE domain-containing protein [Gallionella sp.]
MPIFWNIPLVSLSVLVAITGSFAALDHAQRMRASSGREAKLWMVMGSIVLGLTIWGMHFIGMLAFSLPIPLAYDLTLTFISILPAIAAALLGFGVLCCTEQIGARRLLASGLLMGLGISAMHYTGMAALKMSPPLGYDLPVVVLSVIIAVIASWGALLLMYQGGLLRLPPLARLLLGALVMGLAISGMHYTAMLGTHFQHGSICTANALRIDPGALVVMISLGSMFLFSGSFFLILFNRRVAQQDGQVLAGLVLAFSLMLTWQLWNYVRQNTAQIQQIEFNALVHDVASNIRQRMKAYEQVMRGVDGLLSHSAILVSRKEFHDHIAELHLEEDYPGIQGIRFVPLVPHAEKSRHIAAVRKEKLPSYRIWPEGRRDYYAPVQYVEPFDLRNQQVFGYDMLSDLEYPRPGDAAPGLRRAVLERARDTGDFALSGKVRLLFETREDVQSGVVMALPVYKYGTPHDTVAERRANLSGWIVAVFRMGDLMSGILGERNTDFDIDLFDGGKAAQGMLLFDPDSSSLYGDMGALFKHEELLEIAGRNWTLQAHSLPGFDAQGSQKMPLIIAGGGSALSLLLALFTWFLVSARAKAMGAVVTAERASRKNEMLLRTASDGIYIFDGAGNLVQVNDAYCHMVGYASRELLQMNVAQLNAQLSGEEMLSRIASLGAINPVFETLHRRRDGSIINVEVNASRVEIDGQQLIY